MNWCPFGGCFERIVHSKPIPDPDKLTYLCQAFQEGTARHVVKGLSSEDEYQEAIECLHDQYDKPHLLHLVRIHARMEEPVLKDGSGKELRHLHDNLNQHLRALKVMKYKPSGPFVTAVIESKPD